MAPKGKGKKAATKKICLRCPSDVDDAIKCKDTSKCKLDTGDYADLEKLWPGFPTNPNSSFKGKTHEECERLLSIAETSKDYLYDPITEEMLEQALKISQIKGKSTKSVKTASEAASASSNKPKSAPTHDTGSRIPTEPPRSPPEGPKLSSLHELAIRAREDPFAKLMHNSKLGRSITTPLQRPQMRFEISMPIHEDRPKGIRPEDGNPVDCRNAWLEKLPVIERQVKALKDHTETYTLRPGFADMQKAVFVRSNHFVVDLDPKKEFYEFEILGIPDGASRGRKRDLVETMMLNCPALRDQPDEYATDFKKKVIAWKDLFVYRSQEDPAETRTVTLPGRADPTGKVTDTVLRLNFVRKLSPRDLIDYVQGRQSTFANTGLIEALNILISKGVSEADAQSIEVGTNRFYYKPGHSPLSDGLIAIRGYFASIRPGMGNVLLNVNTVMGSFYDPVRVSVLLPKFRNDNHRAERFLKGVRVRIMYDRASPPDLKGKKPVTAASQTKSRTVEESIDSERSRTKCIWGFGLPPKQQTFEKDNKKIKVFDYLRESTLSALLGPHVY